MLNLAEHAYIARSIGYYRDEVDALRRRLRPGMLFTADNRLEIEGRIAENEQWLARWVERQKQLPT